MLIWTRRKVINFQFDSYQLLLSQSCHNKFPPHVVTGGLSKQLLVCVAKGSSGIYLIKSSSFLFEVWTEHDDIFLMLLDNQLNNLD